MSPVLDATAIQDENELEQEPQDEGQADNQADADAVESESEVNGIDGLGPIRTITIQTPPDCETKIAIIVQENLTNNWYRSGFVVTREYDTSPQEQSIDDFGEVMPKAFGYVEFIDEQEAVETAACKASFWLEHNSDDTDEKAQAAITALDEWRVVLEDSETFTYDESITGNDETKPASDETPAAITAKPATKLQSVDEAQAHFDAETHRIEKIIGKLAIEQVRLKSALKANREAMGTYTEDLENHIDKGPERLPLFDRKPEPEIEDDNPYFETPINLMTGGELDKPVDTATEPTAEPTTETPAETETQDESWRAAKISELSGLTPKIVEILDGHDIRTVGDWADAPKLRGIEYTQLKGITEARYEKIIAAMDPLYSSK